MNPRVRDILLIIIGCGVVLYAMIRSVQKAEDPPRMIFKWVQTALVIGVMFYVVSPLLAIFCSLFLVVIWRHPLTALIAKPFGDLYDGGEQEPDPHPAYSVAQSRQKQGKYLEAVQEIRKQLERFPTDFEGHIMQAEIQACHLKDLAAAEGTIQHLCSQPGHAAKNIAFALYSMADWNLQIGKDAEAARLNLQQIIDLYPESEFALGAANRIAHLGDLEMLLEPHERKKFFVTEGARNLGLQQANAIATPVEIEPGVLAAQYVEHLAKHPYDFEIREKLAIVYADHYGKLDLATDQIEQMVQQPNQPSRVVVHLLNLLADLQIRSGAHLDTVTQTLQRIVERDPGVAAAQIARNRLALVKLELKARQQNQSVKMGSYEQNIGLKRELPGRR